MGTAPHRVDSQHEGPSAGPERDGEPRIPQPQADRRGRMALIVMLAALAIIVLVVLL